MSLFNRRYNQISENQSHLYAGSEYQNLLRREHNLSDESLQLKIILAKIDSLFKRKYGVSKILEITVQHPRNASVPTKNCQQRNERNKAAVLPTTMKHLCLFYTMESINLHLALLVEKILRSVPLTFQSLERITVCVRHLIIDSFSTWVL